MMRIGSVCRCLLVCAVVATASGSPAVGQLGEELGAVPPGDLLFGEEMDVRVVNLEVVVEDGSGERVHGLDREEFRILLDGEEVGVEYFSEVSQGRAGTSANGETPPAVGEGEFVATNYGQTSSARVEVAP